MSITIQTINGKEYKVSPVTDLHFSAETDDMVIIAIDRVYKSKERIRIHLGDKDTGESWLEEYDVMGKVGRSIGTAQIPLLINNSRSLGGGSILTHCILAIQTTHNKRFIYEHKNFKLPNFEIRPADGKIAKGIELNYMVYRDKVLWTSPFDSENVANFKTEEQAKRYIAFMRGERMSK